MKTAEEWAKELDETFDGTKYVVLTLPELKQIQQDAWRDGAEHILTSLDHWHGPDKHDVDEIQHELLQTLDKDVENFGRIT